MDENVLIQEALLGGGKTRSYASEFGLTYGEGNIGSDNILG